MSHQSSSVAQNPAPEQKKPVITPEHQICIVVSFFWADTPKGPIATRDEVASSVCEYFTKRWYILPASDSIQSYYRNMPNWLGRVDQPHDEDLLALFISERTQDNNAFKRMTSIPIPGDLDGKAREHMTKVAKNMKKDGRMEKVKAAWEKYVREMGTLQPASFDSQTFPPHGIERVGLGCDLFLHSNDP